MEDTGNDWFDYWNLTEIICMHLDSAPKAPQLFRTEKDRSVTHQYGVVRCPIRCQPSGSPFEGYEAGSGLSFLWLAFREGHFPSRLFVSSLISIFRSFSFLLFLSLSFCFLSLLSARFSFHLAVLSFLSLLIYQSDEGQCFFALRHRASLRLPKLQAWSRSTARYRKVILVNT